MRLRPKLGEWIFRNPTRIHVVLGSLEISVWIALKHNKYRMKYPAHTISEPATGEAARKIEEAMRTGIGIMNPAYEATIRRILEARKLRIEAEKRTSMQQETAPHAEAETKVHQH